MKQYYLPKDIRQLGKTVEKPTI